MTVLPCPGDRACSAPRPAATSSDRMMIGGVRSAAWNSVVTSLPSWVVPAGTDAEADVAMGEGGATSTPFESSGVASGTSNGGSATPPGLATKVADYWPSGTD